MLSLRNGRFLFHELGTSWGAFFFLKGSDEFTIGYLRCLWDIWVGPCSKQMGILFGAKKS